jgi:hypothetical protein
MPNSTQNYYSTDKLNYKELRRKFIIAKRVIYQQHQETLLFFGEHDARRMRYNLAQLFGMVELRKQAINARYERVKQ